MVLRQPAESMKRTLLPRAIAFRSIRSQTGVLFFAGLFLLVAVVFGISMVVSQGIREDGLTLQQLEADRAAGADPRELDARIAEVRERRDGNTGMVRGMYAALFLASLVFLFIGLWFIQQIIVSPLESLHLVARRVASGDLDTPAELGGAPEFQELAASFESMRLDLRDARARQARWTADLEARVAQRTQQLAALSQVIAIASRSLELDVLMASALEQSLLVMDMEAGGLWLLDEDGAPLRLAAEVRMSPRARARLATIPFNQGATGRAAASGQTIVLEDVFLTPQVTSPVLVEEGFRSMAAVPIRVRERVLGVLDVFTSRPRAFMPDETALLTSVGQQIGLAIDSVRLIHEVRASAERLAGLQERERIAIELHDGLLQTLGYLYLKTDQMEDSAARNGLPDLARQLAAQRDVLENASRDLRRYISDLGDLPPPPTHLVTALEDMIAGLGAEERSPEPLRVDLHFDNPAILLPNDVVVHLVAIAREALTNAAMHGEARNAHIRCERWPGEDRLIIADDGRGFDSSAAPADGRPRFGLSVMQARAARIGGALDIASRPGSGTQVSVCWPCNPVAEEGT